MTPLTTPSLGPWTPCNASGSTISEGPLWPPSPPFLGAYSTKWRCILSTSFSINPSHGTMAPRGFKAEDRRERDLGEIEGRFTPGLLIEGEIRDSLPRDLDTPDSGTYAMCEPGETLVRPGTIKNRPLNIVKQAAIGKRGISYFSFTSITGMRIVEEY